MATAIPEPTKPGYRTTEFWLTAVTVLIGLAYGTGLIHNGGTVDHVIGLGVAVLAKLGYTVSRTLAKGK